MRTCDFCGETDRVVVEVRLLMFSKAPQLGTAEMTVQLDPDAPRDLCPRDLCFECRDALAQDIRCMLTARDEMRRATDVKLMPRLSWTWKFTPGRGIRLIAEEKPDGS